jgi:hypothetical protein
VVVSPGAALGVIRVKEPIRLRCTRGISHAFALVEKVSKLERLVGQWSLRLCGRLRQAISEHQTQLLKL